MTPVRYEIGPFPLTLHNVSLSRALDTTYQNNYGTDIYAVVNCVFTRANFAPAWAYATSRVSDVIAPLKYTIGQYGLFLQNNNPDSIVGNIPIMIPKKWYYRISTVRDAAGSTVSLIGWHEYQLYH